MTKVCVGYERGEWAGWLPGRSRWLRLHFCASRARVRRWLRARERKLWRLLW